VPLVLLLELTSAAVSLRAALSRAESSRPRTCRPYGIIALSAQSLRQRPATEDGELGRHPCPIRASVSSDTERVALWRHLRRQPPGRERISYC